MKHLLTCIFALVFTIGAPTLQAQTTSPKKDIPTIAKAANGAIVTIVMANNDKPISLGTGFLVSADGVIVTNYHVIATGEMAVVKFSDGSALPVDGVLAADKDRDLAIIKVHGKAFRTLTLGNSDRIEVGEEVVAIGNPLGLELTVSNGILSGLRADKEAGGKLLQITAPISHGSSGGPLFNMRGEVIGINSMFYEGGENLNFAIPVNDAKNLLRNLAATVRDLPNEPPPVKIDSVPEQAKEKLWTSDLFGGEFKIQTKASEIRITTTRLPNNNVCKGYGVLQKAFTHDIILDVRDPETGNLTGTLDANKETKKDGKPMIETV